MNFKFQLTAEGDARLVSASGEDGVAVIPDVWEGHPVTVIGEEAFTEIITCIGSGFQSI